MLAQETKQEEKELFRSRLQSLYDSVREWVRARYANARIREFTVTLNEEAVGRYDVAGIEIELPGAGRVRMEPRAMFALGARGWVDVRGPVGREILVWVSRNGPHIRMAEGDVGPDLNQVTKPIYPDVDDGWAWAPAVRGRLLHLTEEVFWGKLIATLSP